MVRATSAVLVCFNRAKRSSTDFFCGVAAIGCFFVSTTSTTSTCGSTTSVVACGASASFRFLPNSCTTSAMCSCAGGSDEGCSDMPAGASCIATTVVSGISSVTSSTSSTSTTSRISVVSKISAVSIVVESIDSAITPTTFSTSIDSDDCGMASGSLV